MRAVVPASGGRVTARAADGTTFVLMIPSGALLSDETVTITPLRSLAGLPGRSRLIAGVQLQPEGLRLMRPATLTIHAAKNLPLVSRQPFGYYGSGQDFYLQPFPRGSGGQSINLMHFSADGEIQASNADRAAQATRVPGPQEAAALQALSEGLAAERRSQLLGQEESSRDLGGLFDAYLRAFFEEAVLPHMFAATTTNDLDFADRAIVDYFTWERSIQLLGLGASEGGGTYAAERAAMKALLPKVLKNEQRIMVERCKKHEVSMVTRLIGLERRKQLLGLADSTGLEQADKCARFTLEFDSVYDITYVDGGTAHHHVHATVPLRLLFSGSQQAPIAYSEWSEHGTTVFPGLGTCTYYSTTTVPDTFTVFALQLDLNPVMPNGVAAAPPDSVTQFLIDPGNPQAWDHNDCTGSAGSYSYDGQPFPQWRDIWGDGHTAESTNTSNGHDGPWDIRSWTRGSGGAFATKHYEIDTPGGGHESTTMILNHTPQL